MMARAASATTALHPAWYTLAAFVERADLSMMHWLVVRQWELANKYGLESEQDSFVGKYDSSAKKWTPYPNSVARAWPFVNFVQSAFGVGPHMLAQDEKMPDGTTRQWVFAWQTSNKISSYYQTNQWYHLQTILNAGTTSGPTPMDWPYNSAFLNVLDQAVPASSPAALAEHQMIRMRTISTKVREAQYANNALALNTPDPTAPDDPMKNLTGRSSRAIEFKQITPIDELGSLAEEDTIYPGLHLMLANAKIKLFNEMYSHTRPTEWRRCTCDPVYFDAPEMPQGQRFCVPPKRRMMNWNKYTGNPMLAGGGGNTDDQVNQYGVFQARQAGADPARVQVWSDWVDAMWPKPQDWTEVWPKPQPLIGTSVRGICPI
jgi:hypothetical protein